MICFIPIHVGNIILFMKCTVICIYTYLYRYIFVGNSHWEPLIINFEKKNYEAKLIFSINVFFGNLVRSCGYHISCVIDDY